MYFGALFLLLDWPLSVLLFIILALGIIVFVAIVSLFGRKPKAEIRPIVARPVIRHAEERPKLGVPSPPSFEKPKPVLAMRAQPERSKAVLKTIEPVSSKCPHGKTREYCAICDPDGYKHHYGDWEKD